MARSADDVTPRNVVRGVVVCAAPQKCGYLRPRRVGPARFRLSEVRRKSFDCKEECARFDRAARVRAGTGRGRLWRGRWRWRSGGASVVVLYGDRVRGRRRPGRTSWPRTSRSRARRGRRPSRSSLRSSSSCSSRSGRPATTTSASSRATTRPRRRASGTRASARRTPTPTRRTTRVIGVIGTFNSGVRPDRGPGPEPGSRTAGSRWCRRRTRSSASRQRRRRATRPSRTSTTRPGRGTTCAWSRTTTYQGAADAEFAQSQGVKNIYILNDKEAYGLGVATNFRDAAESLGIKIAGFEAWDPKATSYTSTFDKVKSTGADAVFLGGLIDENGAQVIKDKVAVLGPNDGAVKLIAPDGFANAGHDRRVGLGVSRDVHVGRRSPDQRVPGKAQGVRGRPPRRPAARARTSTRTRSTAARRRRSVLDAIAASDGSRSDVISKLFASDVQDGLLGSFTFNEDGDPVAGGGPRS